MMYTRPEFNGLSMLAIFCMEVENQIVILNDNLLAIENQSPPNEESRAQCLAALMRSAHSIKGAAKIVGLDLAVDVVHEMENCFTAAKKDQLELTSQAIDILLKGVDWLTQLGNIEGEAQVEWLAQEAHSTRQLISAMAGLLGQPAEPSPAIQTATKTASVESEQTASVKSTPPAPISSLQISAGTSSQNTPETNSLETNSLKRNGVEESLHRPETDAGSANNPANISQLSSSNIDRAVKINTHNLKQLMALAGESLVEANWLHPFLETLQHLKQRQQSLTSLLDKFQQAVTLPSAEKQKLDEAKKIALDCHALLSDRMAELDQFSRRFSQLSDNLYREVVASHMRPLADRTQGFHRMVRDLARAEGKQIKLNIIGQNTQIDRDILNKLEAPLTHMLRNAIVHGIELPEKRQQLGKPETGTICLEASHRAGMLSIIVSDDGSGIELEKLRQSVIQKQLAPPALAAQLSEAELIEFLFLPGFSTAQQVTKLAGRGVGLDIAKSMVQEVGGLLRAFSKPGEGLSFHFQLPLTLSVIRALVVEISGEPYAFALTRIDQIKLVTPEDIAISENHPYIVVNNENISLVKAQQILELPESEASSPATLPVVILREQGHSYGIIVDKFLGERELVVRPLDPRFGKIQDISAAALTEDGLPLLIIDVADLMRSIENLVSGNTLNFTSDRITQTTPQKRILVVDDSFTVREMERQLLQNHGYHVDVAINGMEGWNTVRTGEYDLVISDIDMPRMNGIELVQHIKNHSRIKQLPVIIVSYKDSQADQLAGLHAGADYYLTKSSFQDNSLITAVIDLIGPS